MVKKALLFVLGCFLLCSFASCAMTGIVPDNPYFDENYNEYKNIVDEISLENGTFRLEYAGNVFLPFSGDEVFVAQSDHDIFLGWTGSWWGYQNQYYAFQTDNPLYIYETRIDRLYFREDYDYRADTFVIKNTSAEIVWKDIFGTEQTRFDFQSPITVELYSKQCSRIKATLELEYVEDHWYVSVPGSQSVWILSDEFVEMLSQSGLI